MGREIFTRRPGCRHLVLAGGVALNCVANGRLLREGPFDDIWIQPAAGDAGGALGAALFVWHQLLDKPRAARTDAIARRAASSGRASPPSEIRGFLDGAGAEYHAVPRARPNCSSRSSDLLAEGKIVGWFQGRMEFGPRALGARSILGDPRSPKMQATMNLKIKFRESFRPFAPCVLQERRARVVRPASPGRRARTCCWSRRCCDEHRVPVTDEQRAIMADRPRPAQPGQRRRARRSRPSRTSTTAPGFRPWTRRATRACTRLLERVLSRAPAARCW